MLELYDIDTLRDEAASLVRRVCSIVTRTVR